MDPIKVDFTGKGSGKKKEIVIPPEKALFKTILCIVGTIVLGGLYYYLMLPAMNFKAMEMYYFFGMVIATFIGLTFVTTRAFAKPEYVPYVKRQSIIPGAIIGVLVLVVAVGFLVSSPFFRAKSYSQILDVNTAGNFEEIERQDAESYSNIPRLDELAAANIANRALSDLTDSGLVSQFTIYPLYTQINYKEAPVRVVPLQYASIIKWFTNRSEGLPGYIVIDMAKESADFEKLDQPIRYSPAEHFSRLLKRHLRFQYPTYLFAEPTFEIDDEGNPFWICARLDKTIGLFGGTDVLGAVVVYANDVKGKSVYYDLEAIKTDPEIQWLDRIFSSDLLVEQYNYFGKYQNGFWNSVLGQREVFITTEGYNYIAKADDVFMYTGITSVTSDESITGFALINQRTKEATFYRVSGAKEHSAMAAAEGRVKAFNYVASFPLLINVSGEPTYFMALKDNNQIVQQFAMVNVEQYNKIFVVGQTLADCLAQYNVLLRSDGVEVDIDVKDVENGGNNGGDKEPPVDVDKSVSKTGVISDIRTAVIGAETNYYVQLEGEAAYYVIAASKAEEIIIAVRGANITVTFKEANIAKKIIPLESLKVNS